MFDIGATELLVIGIVAILVVGPKDLPGMLRGFGRTVRTLKGMAADFQGQFNAALDEAELSEVKDTLKKVSDPLKGVTEEAKAQLRKDMGVDEVNETLNEASSSMRVSLDEATGNKPEAEATAVSSTTSTAKPKPATKATSAKKPTSKKAPAKKTAVKKPATKKASARSKQVKKPAKKRVEKSTS